MITPEEVLKLAQENSIKFVDFKFVDLPGTWQHFTIPVHVLTEEVFEEGVPFDGSSVRGFQTIDESDMLVIPDADTAFIDPFTSVPTLSLTCNIAYPTKQPYTRDPRYIAQKAEEFLRISGVADTAYFGPEAEFYIFDGVRYASSDNIQYAEVDSVEAHWNSAGHDDRSNLGHLMNVKGGYFPVPIRINLRIGGSWRRQVSPKRSEKSRKADKRMLIWHHRKRNDPYESEEQNGKQCNTIGESHPECLAGSCKPSGSVNRTDQTSERIYRSDICSNDDPGTDARRRNRDE